MTNLTEILAASDARASLQAAMIAGQNTPLVSMTLVSPGPVKDDKRRRRLMDLAEEALAVALETAGFRFLKRTRRDGPTGPEAIYAVAAPPVTLKALAVQLENNLSWGRLLDADVVVGEAPGSFPVPISRSIFGLGPRTCLLCGNDARLCMAEHRHKAIHLAKTVEAIIDGIPRN